MEKRVKEIMVESHALLNGHFLLTSGRHSNQYVQCAKILQNPGYAAEIIEVLSRAFEKEHIDIVIGPAMGGIVIAYELARQLGVLSMFAEREQGNMKIRRFEIPSGARVLVAEDVITTGGSVQEVMDVVREAGAEIAGVCVLVDRSGGKIDFGVPLKAAYTTEVISYSQSECPLCKEGVPVVKPGSRQV